MLMQVWLTGSLSHVYCRLDVSVPCVVWVQGTDVTSRKSEWLVVSCMYTVTLMSVFNGGFVSEWLVVSCMYTVTLMSVFHGGFVSEWLVVSCMYTVTLMSVFHVLCETDVTTRKSESLVVSCMYTVTLMSVFHGGFVLCGFRGRMLLQEPDVPPGLHLAGWLWIWLYLFWRTHWHLQLCCNVSCCLIIFFSFFFCKDNNNNNEEAA